ncbi:hypothetical protein [Aestuariivita boseongensis]|uniref:hypothetical protein n=1 Tax=Aestuariivita boseongensis TaxID=1470562 RepID=UPI000680D284|nr:hypothetical protein [Aestuariivita boseongensis]
MKFKLTLALVAAFGLPGCEVPVMIAAANNDAQLSGLTTITFPAKMVVNVADTEQVYAGTMLGRMSGAAEIEMTSQSGETCTGSLPARGAGQMVCGARVFVLDRREDERQSMSGVVYRTGSVEGYAYQTAFGWGRGAEETVLRQSIAQERSLSAKETRELNPG